MIEEEERVTEGTKERNSYTEFTEGGAQRSQRQLGPRREEEGGSSGGAAGEAVEEREIGRDTEVFDNL